MKNTYIIAGSIVLSGIIIASAIKSNNQAPYIQNDIIGENIVEDDFSLDSNEDNDLTKDILDNTINSNENLQVSDTIVQKIDNLDFQTGSGIQWSDGIFAPFADMTAWTETISNNGAINLATVLKETGVKFYNLGFINAVDGTITNQVLNWGFGGYDILNEKNGAENLQYQGIKTSIRQVRENGGDVTISIGGLNERNFFQYTDDVTVLKNTYLEIIDGFNLTRIDLDIEGSAQGYEKNIPNAKAMKIVQDATDVQVVLTLPVLPTGLTSDLGLPTLQAYLDEGVNIKAVNIMAMCYGSYFGEYGKASLQAIDSTMSQLKQEYEKIGISLTDAQAYNKIGVTTSIGFESEAHPIFTTSDSKLVVDYANEKGVSFVSFWSINRDTLTFDNKGISTKYEHTPIYLKKEVVQVDILDIKDQPYLIWTREDEAIGKHVPNTIVTHNGKIYKQVSSDVTWWCEPGTDSNIWKEQ